MQKRRHVPAAAATLAARGASTRNFDGNAVEVHTVWICPPDKEVSDVVLGGTAVAHGRALNAAGFNVERASVQGRRGSGRRIHAHPLRLRVARKLRVPV